MNPLTLVKRIQNINSKEASLGVSEDASWHAGYKDSAYVYVGGIPFDLTEGDLLAIFAQYGEIVDVNLVRDKGTGKSKGFAFIAYEDQRSTILAVDNLNGAQVIGRTIRVDHVSKYKKKEEEDEETVQQKREERGVCRAFQRGECTRGDGCKFSHNEQRAANTGWGAEDHRKSRRGDDKFEGSARIEKQASQLGRVPHSTGQDERRLPDKDVRESRVPVNERGTGSHRKQTEFNSRDRDDRGIEKRVERQEREKNHKDVEERQRRENNQKDSSEQRREKEMNHKDIRDRQSFEERSKRRGIESDLRESGSTREENGSRKRESESHHSEDMKNRGRDKRRSHDRDSSPHRCRTDEDRPHKSRR